MNELMQNLTLRHKLAHVLVAGVALMSAMSSFGVDSSWHTSDYMRWRILSANPSRISTSGEENRIDLNGWYGNGWVISTYSSGGFYLHGRGLPSDASVYQDAEFICEGHLVKITYTVVSGATPIHGAVIGSNCDVMIGSNDRAALEVIKDKNGRYRGFQMIDDNSAYSSYGARLKLYFRNTAEVTNCDRYWFGQWSTRKSYWDAQISKTTMGGYSQYYTYDSDGETPNKFIGCDSGLCISWDVDLPANASREYSFVVGIGQDYDPPEWVSNMSIEVDGSSVTASAAATDVSGYLMTMYAKSEPNMFEGGEVALDSKTAQGSSAPVTLSGQVDVAEWTNGTYSVTFWLMNEKGSMGEAKGRLIEILDGQILTEFTRIVSFDAQGGEGRMDPLVVQYGDSVTVPECRFTYTGLDFAGWATKPGGRVEYTRDVTITSVIEDSTLYAVWVSHAIAAPVAKAATDVGTTSFVANWTRVSNASCYRIDVSTDANFASLVSGYASKRVEGENVTISGLPSGRTYYYRVRAVTVAGSSSVNSNTIVVPLNATLSFDACGGSGHMNAIVCISGSSVALPPCGFTKAGHGIAGWATYEGGEVTYVPEGVIPALNSDMTLFAVWTPMPDFTVQDIQASPASVAPGDSLNVVYKLTNSGFAGIDAVWHDAIYLESSDGAYSCRLGDVSNNVNMTVGRVIENNVAFVLPESLPIAGASRVVIKVDDLASVGESDESNTFASESVISVATNLYLSASSASVSENNSSGVRFTVKRSGPTTVPMTVSVTVDAANQVSFPETVTIPAGNVSTIFTVKPIDNEVVDGGRTIAITVRSGDCRPASCDLAVTDNEVPKLTITLDRSSIKEGEGKIVATVTRELVTGEPLTVYLSGVSTSRCSYPSSVVIPAGEASVTFEIEPINNETAEIASDLTLRASSAGYTSAAVTYRVEDDDVPGVTLAITPEVVSEGAGPQAIYATLTRSDQNQIDKAVRIKLTPSVANQLIMPSEITIPKYTMAVRFAIGVIDNGLDDGDREVTIDGAIVIESCGCSGQPSNGDVIQAVVGIIDNDGPSLSLTASPATMKEGLNPAGYLTLSHNSALEEDLTVNLWIDEENADELVIPETATIPAGQTSVRISVQTLDDGVEDGGQLVSIYAEDESGVFAPASTWVQVSDQNLPDLTVAEIVVPNSVVAGKPFDCRAVVTNIGFMAAGKDVPYAIHLVRGANGGVTSDANRVLVGKIPHGLPVETSVEVEFSPVAPPTTGDYRIAVVIDPDGTLSELDDGNNTGWSSAVNVNAAYTATVAAEGKVFSQGSSVALSGRAVLADDTVPAVNVPVDVYVLVNGMRRTLSAVTDAQGAFQVQFTPTATEAGRYSVGACYPGVASSVEQDYFDILGMKLGSTSAIKFEMSEGDSAVRTVSIKNRSKTPLTGLKATLSNVLEDVWELSSTLPETLPGDGVVTFRLAARSIGVSPVAGEWDVVPVSISSDEGVTLSFDVYLYAQPQRARLSVSPSAVEMKMTVGQRRLLDFSLSNDGKGDSGRITVNIPSVPWMRLVSPKTIDNLKGGESATVTIELDPQEEHHLTLNMPLSGGRLEAVCENGTSSSASLCFTPVSDATGSIKVDVIDNAYYNSLDGSAPHLAGAKVRLSNRYENDKTVASGVTGADGIWTAGSIPVGEYQLTISADKHDSYAAKVVINPGQVTKVEKFLKCNLITTSWDVKKTEIEDQYEITMLLDFDTQVPSSKVEMTLPDELPVLNEGESWTFIVHLVNSGVIQAENVQVTMPEIPGYTFTLSENDITLPAKSSVDISVLMSRPSPMRYVKDMVMPELAEVVDVEKADIREGFSTSMASDECICYRLPFAVDETRRNVKVIAPTSANVWWGFGFVPNGGSYSGRAIAETDPVAFQVPVSETDTDVYLVVNTLRAGGISVMLDAASPAVSNLSVTELPSSGAATIRVSGTGLGTVSEATLFGANEVKAKSVRVENGTTLLLTFDCSELKSGTVYKLRLTGEGVSLESEQSVTVIETAGNGVLDWSWKIGSMDSATRICDVTVTIKNTGSSNLICPMFLIRDEGMTSAADAVGFSLDGEDFMLGNFDFLATDANGGFGEIAPGDEYVITLKMKLPSGRANAEGVTMCARTTSDSMASYTTEIDRYLPAEMRNDAESSDDEAFKTRVARLRQVLGETNGEMIANLARLAAKSLENEPDLKRQIVGELIEYGIQDIGEQVTLQLKRGPSSPLVLTAGSEIHSQDHETGAYLYPNYEYIHSGMSLNFSNDRVAVIAHGRADGLWESTWMGEMASALIGSGEIDKVICINWSLLAVPPLLNPTYGVSDHIPEVVEVVSGQLSGLGLNAAKCTFIGHSYGAHLVGRLAMRMFGSGSACRHVGLDTARTALSVSADIAISGNCTARTEFYRSSPTYGRDDAYAKYNFIVTRSGSFIGRNDVDAISLGMDEQTSLHADSYRWFTDSIRNGRTDKLGFWFDPATLDDLPKAESGFQFVIDSSSHRYECVYPYTGIYGEYPNKASFKYPGGGSGWTAMRNAWRNAFDLKIDENSLPSGEFYAGDKIQVNMSMTDTADTDINTIEQTRFYGAGSIVWKRHVDVVDPDSHEIVLSRESVSYSRDTLKPVQFTISESKLKGLESRTFEVYSTVSHGYKINDVFYFELDDLYPDDNSSMSQITVLRSGNPTAVVNGEDEDGFVITKTIRFDDEEDYNQAAQKGETFSFAWTGNESEPGKNARLRQYVWTVPVNNQGQDVISGAKCSLRYSKTVNASYPIKLTVVNSEDKTDSVAGTLKVEVVIGGKSGDGGDGNTGGHGDGGEQGGDSASCWVPVRVKYYEPCGKERPEYGYTKYVKHGECTSNETLIKTIQDNWREEGSSGGGGAVGGPSTGGGGGGSGTGGFSGNGRGFTYTIDDCNKTTEDGGSGLTPCQKSLLNCGKDILLNFIPGSEYVMAIPNAIECHDNVKEAYDSGNTFDKIDAVANCAFNAAGYIPGADWYATGASCVWNITKECAFRYSEKKDEQATKRMLLASPVLAASDASGELTDFERAAALYGREIEASTDWLIEFFGSSAWCNLSCAQIRQFINDFRATLDENHELSAELIRQLCPAAISDADLVRFVSRWNTTVRALAAQTPLADTDDEAGQTDYLRLGKFLSYSEALESCATEAVEAGYDTAYDFFRETLDRELKALESERKSVCASVRLQLSQTLAMTREAFEGTLTLFNGHSTVVLTDLKMEVSILDEAGNECKDLFVTTDLGNEGAMSGGYVLDGGLSVAPNSTGSAVLQFVPSRAAAPTVEKPYSFGGSITYVDPFSGKLQKVDLIPVTLMVSPSPYLKLDYFIQRDVYGDDPFTPDVVEASMPAEMAVRIRNEGGGKAKNVTISSVQPSVVLNEKGLAVDFSQFDYKLDSTALNGATAHLGLNDVSIGTISPGGTHVAQWWLTSSIDGHFKDMSATVTPVNSWNTPDTVLVNPVVGMHKLIRSLEVEGESLPYFLTSEQNDVYGEPDSIFDPNEPNGEPDSVRHDARVSLSGAPVGTTPTLSLSVSVQELGWQYVKINVPGSFRYKIISIVRSDGKSIPVRNAWITDRTFRDGLDPLLEENLHLADEIFATGDYVYEITLQAKPTEVPEVLSFEGVTDGGVEYEARDEVMVMFTKEIDPATFTTDDLGLVWQGVHVDELDGITISGIAGSPTSYLIRGLSSLCNTHGRYELTVQCAGIADLSGQLGAVGKSVSWTYSGSDSPYIVDAEGVPVRPVRNLDSIVAVTSLAIEPTSFSNARIMLNGADVSASLAVRAIDASDTRYEISGLEALQREDGLYTMVIEGSDLRGLDGSAGVNTFTRSWMRDATPPVLESVSHEKGMSGNVVTLAFTEEIDGATLTVDKVRLTRDGQEVALPPSARVDCVAEGTYALSGFDAAVLADGAYGLTVDSAGVADVAGNVATGTRSVSWTVDTTPPAKPAELGVSSEYGSIDTVVNTCERTMMVTGVVGEPGASVQVLYRYVGGVEVLLATPTVATDGSFSANVELPENGGNLTLIVRQTDAVGNSSDAEISVYYDKIALAAELSGAPELDVPADAVTLAFSDAVIGEDVALAKFALTRNGESVALDGLMLVPNGDGKAFTLQGLASLCSVDGDYVLSFAATDVRKRSSGLKSSECAPLSWRYECPDREPPTIVTVQVDGEEARDLYTNGISSVAIEFSENVNVQELAQNGLIGQALRIELLDADLNATGAVRAVQSDVACGDDGIVWTLPNGAVGPGSARIVVDAGLVADLAGNKLAVGEYAVVAGLQGFDFKSDIVATVDSYAMPTWYDFDGDGLGDLVVGEKTSAGEGKVRVYRNVGSATEPRFGGFTYLTVGGSDLSIAASGCQGAQVAFGDLTGDGNDDLIVGYANGKVQMWYGTATRGTYGDTEVLVTGSEQTYGSDRAFVCPYDLDGDGKLELAIGGLDGKFRMFKYVPGGASTESWLTDAAGVPLTVAAGRSTPVLVDVNNDGCVDILTGDTSGNVWAFLGNGETWNSTAVPVLDNTTARQSDRTRIGYGDVNGDGIGDLLVGRTNGSVELALGDKVAAPTVTFRILSADELTPKSFPVVFNAMGGVHTNGLEVMTNDCFVADGYVLPKVERDGYTFVGWYNGWTNGTEVVTNGQDLLRHEPHTLYAKWWANKTSKEGEGTEVIGSEVVPGAETAIITGAVASVGTDFVIPDRVSNGADGAAVVEIGQEAFCRAKCATAIRSVTTPVHLKKIGVRAFYQQQSLSKLVITPPRKYDNPTQPEDLQICQSAFAGTAIEDVEIPDAKVTIDAYAFQNCKTVKTITFLGDGANVTVHPTAFKLAGRANGTGGLKIYASQTFLGNHPTLVDDVTKGNPSIAVYMKPDEGKPISLAFTASPEVLDGGKVRLTLTAGTKAKWANPDISDLKVFGAVAVGRDYVELPHESAELTSNGEVKVIVTPGDSQIFKATVQE